MKRLILFAVIMIALMIPLYSAGALTLDGVLQAGFEETGWIGYKYTGEIDSLETLTSAVDITLWKKYYDVVEYKFEYELTKSASGDTLNVIFYAHQSSTGTDYAVVDTLATGTTETYTYVKPDMNSTGSIYNKIVLTGSTGNYNNVTFECIMWVKLKPIFDIR